MGLNQKAIVILVSILLVFTIFTYVITHFLLLKSYISVEHRQMLANTSRAQMGLQRNLATLKTFTMDWAHYDEGYEFVAGKNPKWSAENVNITSLANSNINLMIFFDLQGRIVFGVAADTVNGKFIPYPKGLAALLKPNSILVERKNLHDDIAGLINLPDGIMMIASSAVSNGDLTKPMNGTLITGRFLSEQIIQLISETANLKLNLFTLNQINADNNLRESFQNTLFEKNGIYIQTGDSNNIYGYSILKDIYNKPIGLLRVNKRRDVFITGNTNINYLYAVLVLLLCSFAIIIWYTLRKIIVQRLKYLNNTIQNISTQKQYGFHFKPKGNDEISSLMQQFNEMIGIIQNTHQELKLHVEQLSISEKKLAETNLQLNKEIDEKNIAKEKTELLYRQLLRSARLAGKAEVATSILHNLGNILTSTKVRTEMLFEKSYTKEFKYLSQLIESLKEHKDHLAEFLTVDSKGKLIPDYLAAIMEYFETTQPNRLQELKNLQTLVQNIEEIVAMQKTIHTNIEV